MKFFRLISALLLTLFLLLFSSEARAVESIFFRINNSDIDSGFKDNAQVLQSIQSALAARTPSQVRIHAAASPDGPTALNTRLSRERAYAGVTLIKSMCPGIADSSFVVTTTAEDIDGAIYYIGKSGKEWADEAIQVLGRAVSNPEEGLRHIHGGSVWRYLADEVFPLLRKTEIEFVFETEAVVPVVETPDPTVEEPVTQITAPSGSKSGKLPWWSIALMGLLGAGAATFGGLFLNERKKNRALSAHTPNNSAFTPATRTAAPASAPTAAPTVTPPPAATTAATAAAVAATAATASAVASSAAAPETPAESSAPETPEQAAVESSTEPAVATPEAETGAIAGEAPSIDASDAALAAAAAATVAVAAASAADNEPVNTENQAQEPEDLPEEAAAPSDFATKVYDLIEENIGNADFGVEQLAEAMGMSRIHLNRKLKAESISSPSTLLKEARMKLASNLIRENTLSMADISSKCGFATPSYFSTAFKDFYGVTPSEYK